MTQYFYSKITIYKYYMIIDIIVILNCIKFVFMKYGHPRYLLQYISISVI